MEIIRLESQAFNLFIKCEKLKDLLNEANHAKNQIEHKGNILLNETKDLLNETNHAKKQIEHKCNILEIDVEFYFSLLLY